jgi:predicted N-acetyltransferase YhbS
VYGARTYVSCSAGRVVGYYALATTSVLRDSGTSRARRGMPDPIPAILLGRLAVDQHRQSQGLGRSLLQDAARRTLAAAESIGVRVLLGHALREEVRGFYLRYGFESSPTDPLHLMLLLKDARAALESAGGGHFWRRSWLR